MAVNPGPEDTAEYILQLFVEQHALRSGEVLMQQNFMVHFLKAPWRTSDFGPGVSFAIAKGWVEPLKAGTSFRLTDAGYNHAGEREMNLERQCKDVVTIEHADGTRHENVKALVTPNIVMVPDAKIPISPDDIILRELPSGLVERMVVTDPAFNQGLGPIRPHYQARYKREGEKPAGTPGYVIHVTGPNSRVNINSVDQSQNAVRIEQQDLGDLAVELEKLRTALVQNASTAEHYSAIGSIASAETAAKEGDKSKVEQALSALGSAGKWVAGVAKDIGVPIAVAVLKAHAGLPPT